MYMRRKRSNSMLLFEKWLLPLILTMLILLGGCSESNSDTSNEICGKWVEENIIDGLPEWQLMITESEITVYQGQYIWTLNAEYAVTDDIITGISHPIKPYLHLEIHRDDDGYLRIYGITLKAESGEHYVRHIYVKAADAASAGGVNNEQTAGI